MRIAHIVRRFTFSEWGGTESVVLNIALQQKLQGLEPEILCTSALDKAGSDSFNDIPIHRFNYLYPYFPMPKKDKLALDKKGGNPFSIGLLKALKNGNYDIFHIHAGGRIANCAVKLGKKLGIPCVMSLHGGSCVIPQQELELMLQPLKNKFSYGGIIDRIFKLRVAPESGMDKLLALSYEETVALQKKFPGVEVETFPNGILPRTFKGEGDFRTKYQLPRDKRIILCISRIDYQKNQKLLVELLSKKADSHLLLIGPVTAKWYFEEINQLADKLGVSECMTVIPGLAPDSEELLQALKVADCFILPSHHEPFGIVALEALDARVPLIAANVGGLKDFLVNGENALLFEDNNLEELSFAYDKIDSMRETLIENGYQTSVKYNWKSLSERLTAIYREIAR